MDNIKNVQSNRFCNQLEQAIEESKSTRQIDDFVKNAYQYLGEGLLEDEHVSKLHELAILRRKVLTTRTVANRIPQRAAEFSATLESCYPDKIYKKMPTAKKAVYMARRRELAASGMIPRELGKHFTTGALATLTVIAQEVGANGSCRLSLGKLAALAGVCKMTCRRALKLAMKHKLLDISERRQSRGRKSLTNIVRIMNRTWLQWVDRRYRKEGNQTPIMKELLSKLKLPSFDKNSSEVKEVHKCYPTLSTNIKYRNRLVADYSLWNTSAHLPVFAPPT